MFKRSTIALSLLATLSLGAQAAVVNSADVNGLRTFQDTATGRVWLDMDNFFDSATGVGTITPDQMINIAQAAGFTWATRADVEQLLATLPLNNGGWAGYANVMGYGQPRNLIWGGYDDGSAGQAGWAFAYSGDQNWGINDDSLNTSVVAAGNSPGDQDLGLWAYRTSAVPEASSYAMVIAGLLTVGAITRRRKI